MRGAARRDPGRAVRHRRVVTLDRRGARARGARLLRRGGHGSGRAGLHSAGGPRGGVRPRRHALLRDRPELLRLHAARPPRGGGSGLPGEGRRGRAGDGPEDPRDERDRRRRQGPRDGPRQGRRLRVRRLHARRVRPLRPGLQADADAELPGHGAGGRLLPPDAPGRRLPARQRLRRLGRERHGPVHRARPRGGVPARGAARPDHRLRRNRRRGGPGRGGRPRLPAFRRRAGRPRRAVRRQEPQDEQGLRHRARDRRAAGARLREQHRRLEHGGLRDARQSSPRPRVHALLRRRRARERQPGEGGEDARSWTASSRPVREARSRRPRARRRGRDRPSSRGEGRPRRGCR